MPYLSKIWSKKGISTRNCRKKRRKRLGRLDWRSKSYDKSSQIWRLLKKKFIFFWKIVKQLLTKTKNSYTTFCDNSCEQLTVQTYYAKRWICANGIKDFRYKINLVIKQLKSTFKFGNEWLLFRILNSSLGRLMSIWLNCLTYFCKTLLNWMLMPLRKNGRSAIWSQNWVLSILLITKLSNRQ